MKKEIKTCTVCGKTSEDAMVFNVSGNVNICEKCIDDLHYINQMRANGMHAFKSIPVETPTQNMMKTPKEIKE